MRRFRENGLDPVSWIPYYLAERRMLRVLGFQLLANVLEGFAQQRPKIGMSLLLKLFDQRRNDIGDQLAGGSDQEGLGTAAGCLGAAFELDVSGVP